MDRYSDASMAVGSLQGQILDSDASLAAFNGAPTVTSGGETHPEGTAAAIAMTGATTGVQLENDGTLAEISLSPYQVVDGPDGGEIVGAGLTDTTAQQSVTVLNGGLYTSPVVNSSLPLDVPPTPSTQQASSASTSEAPGGPCPAGLGCTGLSLKESPFNVDINIKATWNYPFTDGIHGSQINLWLTPSADTGDGRAYDYWSQSLEETSVWDMACSNENFIQVPGGHQVWGGNTPGARKPVSNGGTTRVNLGYNANGFNIGVDYTYPTISGYIQGSRITPHDRITAKWWRKSGKSCSLGTGDLNSASVYVWPDQTTPHTYTFGYQIRYGLNQFGTDVWNF